MPVGAFGLGKPIIRFSIDFDQEKTPGFYGLEVSSPTNGPRSNAFGQLMVCARDASDRVVQVFFDSLTNVMHMRSEGSSSWGSWAEMWSSANTTVDGSGFILEASPIVRVHPDSIDEPNKPVGATLTHPETGVYALSGVEPLATEGWQVRTPSDFNGNKVVAITEPEYDAETRTLTLRTHDLLWHEGRLVPGEPMDIPDGHFVMLRLHEPETPDPEA